MENELMIATEEKEFYISTREVAEMMGREHKRLLRMLEGDSTHKGIIPALTKAQLGLSDFFKESYYIDASGKKSKHYLCTKKGCDMLAHKMTGEKGTLFTAKYINRFYEMEEQIKKQQKDLLLQEYKKQISEEVFELKKELLEFKEMTQKADSLIRMTHKNKLTFNKLIKQLANNKDEQDAIKTWVLASLNCTKWQDVPVSKYSKVIELINTSAALISTKKFEQTKLL